MNPLSLINSFALPSTGSDVIDFCLISFILTTTYVFGLGIYRLYLSPIAKFPGPKLAALTQWYETYYDVYLDGKFTLHFKELHEKYGMLIRPNIHHHPSTSHEIDRTYRANQSVGSSHQRPRILRYHLLDQRSLQQSAPAHVVDQRSKRHLWNHFSQLTSCAASRHISSLHQAADFQFRSGDPDPSRQSLQQDQLRVQVKGNCP